MTDFSPFFRAHAHRLQQAPLYWPPGHPTLGQPPWAAAGLRVLIVRLSAYRDVDRSTPHLWLADAVRRGAPDAGVDFAFFPPPRDRDLLRAHGVPLLTGLRSGRTADEFGLVLISNAHTLELINLPFLLVHSGIPPLAADRAGRWPPLVLGGANALAAQALVDRDAGSFVDAFFFGEGEGRVEQLAQAFRRRAAAAPPGAGPAGRDLLLALECRLPGLWVTGRWPARPVRPAVWARPAAARLPAAYPALNGPEAGTARLQISCGCPAFCAFCFEGWDRKPYRELSAAGLLAAARRLKRAQGCDTLELYSFNFNLHRDILRLLPELSRLFDRVRGLSQRADRLQTTPGLLAAELAADKRTFTLGIEGLSARLRAALHKGLDTAELEALLARLCRPPVRELKLFYLLTGDETAADEAEFGAFCRRLQALRRQQHPGPRVVFSFGLLVRMPFTPLRHDRLRLEPGAWEPRLRAARRAVESAGAEFRLALTWPEYAAAQMLALAPYGLPPALTALARAGGCYDQTLRPDYARQLRERLIADGLWTADWLGEKPADYPFPFAFVAPNVRPDFLYRSFRAARAGREDGACLGREGAPGRCRACGACATPAARRRLTAPRARPPAAPAGPENLAAAMAAKARLPPLYGRCWLAPELAGAEPEWLNAHVLRTLLAARPDQTGNLLAARESLFTRGVLRERFPIFCGETVFALKAWDAAALQAALPAPPAPGGRLASVLAAHGLRWLGPAAPFAPGVFRSRPLELRLPAEFFPDAAGVFQRWLQARHVAFSLRRTADGYRYELARARPAWLSAAETAVTPAGFSARLIVGPQFDLGGLLAAWGTNGLFRRATALFGAENAPAEIPA